MGNYVPYTAIKPDRIILTQIKKCTTRGLWHENRPLIYDSLASIRGLWHEDRSLIYDNPADLSPFQGVICILLKALLNSRLMKLLKGF
jgi:hypothetical protein